MHIFIVDDEADILDVNRLILEMEGHTVVTEVNPKNAVGIIQAHQFDLIISDNHMPGLDGIDLVKKIRELKILTPIILTSGTSISDDSINELINGFIEKPYDPDLIIEMVANIAS